MYSANNVYPELEDVYYRTELWVSDDLASGFLCAHSATRRCDWMTCCLVLECSILIGQSCQRKTYVQIIFRK